MKLTELYIENFGKLSSFKYSFSQGLNTINEDNGYGKSTLAVFIKSMLYGMEDTKRVKLDENDRKKYMPWGGGVCGGTLTFTVGKKKYRIERTFAPKASDDTFTLYDCESGKVSDDYTENLGDELFGINADGFERTVFLSERRLSVKNDNKTISAKLSDLVGYDCDLGELDEANAALEDRRKYYQKRGGAGKISDIKARITDIETEINEILRIREQLPECEHKAAECEKEIKRLESVLTKFESRKQTLSYEKQYLTKKATKDEAEARLQRARKFFEGGMPTQAEVRLAERTDGDYRALRERIAISKDTPDNSMLLTKDIAEAERLTECLKGKSEIKKKASPAVPMLLLLAIMLCAGGGAIAAALSMYAGIAMMVAGVAALISAVAIGIRSKASAAEPPYLADVRAMLSREGIQCESDAYLAALLEIKVKKENDLRICSERLEAIRENEREMNALKANRDEFLAKFPTLSDDPYDEIRTMLKEYEYADEHVRQLSAELATIVREYGVNVEKLNQGSVILSETADGDTLDECKENLRRVRGEHVLAERECRRYREEIARLDELYAQREELTDSLNECKERLNIITLAREHLNKAKDQLTAKYLGKTRDAFAEYLKVIGNDDPTLFTMDTSFGVTRSEGGQSKPQEAYSLGTREMFALVSRLALIDSLYDKELPFILLDDPFVHFDDKRTQAALKALKRIADKKQIIYLTCSKSRSV